MAQLRLPILGRKPEHLRAPPPPPDITPKAPQEPVVIKEVFDPEGGEKGSYDQLLDELEGLIRRLQDTLPHGPEFIKAWHKARADICVSYGWTSEEFYDELDRRRQERWTTTK